MLCRRTLIHNSFNIGLLQFRFLVAHNASNVSNAEVNSPTIADLNMALRKSRVSNRSKPNTSVKQTVLSEPTEKRSDVEKKRTKSEPTAPSPHEKETANLSAAPFYPHYRDGTGKLVPYTRNQYIAELKAKGKSTNIPNNVMFAPEPPATSNKKQTSIKKDLYPMIPIDNDLVSQEDDDFDEEADLEFTSDFADLGDTYEDEEEEEDQDQKMRRSSLLEQLELEEQGKVQRSVNVNGGGDSIRSGTLKSAVTSASKQLSALSTDSELDLMYQQSVDRLNLKGLRYDHKIKMWVETSTGLTMTNNDINEAHYQAYRLKKRMMTSSQSVSARASTMDSILVESRLENEVASSGSSSSGALTNVRGFKPPDLPHEVFHNLKKATRPRDADGRRISHTALRQQKHRERFEALPPKTKLFPQREKRFLVASVLEQDYELFVAQLSRLVDKYVIKHKGPLYQKIDTLLGTIDKDLIESLDDIHAMQLTYCLGKLVLSRMWNKEVEQQKRTVPSTENNSNSITSSSGTIKADKKGQKNISSVALESTESAISSVEDKVSFNVSLALTDKSPLTVSDRPKLTPNEIVDLLHQRLLKLRVGLTYTEGLRCLEGMQGLNMLDEKRFKANYNERQDLLDAVFLSMTGKEVDPDDMTEERFLSFVQYLSVLKIDWDEIPRSTRDKLALCLEEYAQKYTPEEVGALLRQIFLINWDIRGLGKNVLDLPFKSLQRMLESDAVNGKEKVDTTVLQTMMYLLDGMQSVGTPFRALRTAHRNTVHQAVHLIALGQSPFQISRALMACLQMGMTVEDMHSDTVEVIRKVENAKVESLMDRICTPRYANWRTEDM